MKERGQKERGRNEENERDEVKRDLHTRLGAKWPISGNKAVTAVLKLPL